jgi:tetratricopeptide (TPR) repeat protein
MRTIILSLIIITCTAPAFAQDTVESLRTQIESATVDSDRIRLIANSNALDPVGFYNLGNTLARLGDNEAAIAAYRKAITQRKGYYSRALNNLGVVLLRTGRWDEAQEALVSALRLENFHYAEASYNLGRVYAARGQNDLAAREWRRVLAIDPQHDGAKQALATGGNEERIVVAASPSAKPVTPVSTVNKSSAAPPKTLTIDQTSYDLLQQARSAVERGKMTDAVNDFQRLLRRQNGYFPPANLELSYALLSLKRYDEAQANLLEVSKRDGARYPISYFHLARLYERNGDLKSAEAAFAQVAPTNAQFLLDLSRVREKLGDYKGSLEAMERYVKLMQDQGQRPDWSEARLADLRTKAARQD